MAEQRREATAKGDQGIVIQALVAEKDDGVLRPCASNLGNGRSVNLAADVDAADLCAQRASDWRNGDAVIFVGMGQSSDGTLDTA